MASERAHPSRLQRVERWVLGGLGALGLLGAVAVAVLPLVSRKLAVYIPAAVATPTSYRGALRQFAAAYAVRRYALPPDSSITPKAAGEAYHRLILWPDSARIASLQPAPGSAANPWSGAEGVDSVGSIPPKRWCGELIQRAARGLSKQDVAVLRRVAAPQPRDTLFRTFARAREADILGTRWTFDGMSDEALFYYKLPIPRSSPFRSAVGVWCARAALELQQGRADDAERTLREALSASVLLADEGPIISEALSGVKMAKAVARDLANLYQATGRGTEANAIRVALDSAVVPSLPGRLAEEGIDAWDVIEALPAAAKRPDVPRGLKWEWMQVAQSVKVQQYCVRDDDWGHDYQTWLDSVAIGLVRRPSDGDYLDWITEKPLRQGADCYRGQVEQ